MTQLLSHEFQQIAVDAICHAALMAQVSVEEAAAKCIRPHLFYKPKLYQDGNQWCALLGENLQEGVCGFGDTPADAMHRFDVAWASPIGEIK